MLYFIQEIMTDIFFTKNVGFHDLNPTRPEPDPTNPTKIQPEEHL